jgi:hypothetical protein
MKLIKDHDVKTYAGVGEKLHAFLTAALGRGYRLASLPRPLSPSRQEASASIGQNAGLALELI